jgi:ABC-type spermidine/putrescine transport system permease subunit II
MVKLGITPEINALSSIMLFASILLVFLSFVFQRGGDGKIDIV